MNATNCFNDFSIFHFNYVVIWLCDLKQIVFYVTLSLNVFFKNVPTQLPDFFNKKWVLSHSPSCLKRADLMSSVGFKWA